MNALQRQLREQKYDDAQSHLKSLNHEVFNDEGVYREAFPHEAWNILFYLLEEVKHLDIELSMLKERAKLRRGYP